MGIGTGSGENRVVDAVKGAIGSPLLETSIDGAKAILFNIMGGYDLGMLEVNEAADLVQKAAASDANIIFGTSINGDLEDEIRVTVIATGFEDLDEDPDLAELMRGPEEPAEDEVGETAEPEAVEPSSETEEKSASPRASADTIDVPDFLKNAAAKLRD